MSGNEVAGALARTPPFDALPDDVRSQLGAAGQVEHYGPHQVILDAFHDQSDAVFVVIAGRVGLWHDITSLAEDADEIVEKHGVFGFSSMLTDRSVGPRAVALRSTIVARIPEQAALRAFASPVGARFLATQLARRFPKPAVTSGFATVDELLHGPPVVVPADATVAEAAQAMTQRRASAVVIDGTTRVVTDGSLRRRVLADGLSPAAPAVDAALEAAPKAIMGEATGEALVRMLEAHADAILVLDREGGLRGALTTQDFTLAPATPDVTLHEEIRRAVDQPELAAQLKKVPDLLTGLLDRGLAGSRVVAAYSGIVDTVIRKAIDLTIAKHPDLTEDAFTWMALGSNGRREAVLSSDVDSAVVFANDTSPEDILRYRVLFAEIDDLLGSVGLLSDEHGTSARKLEYSRTQREWQEAATHWLEAPELDRGAIMTSLLVDGRPIYGDAGLPGVTVVFQDLRRQPGTLKLLLQDSLARRAKLRSRTDTLLRRGSQSFDIKKHALLPLVNLARWGALAVQSPALNTMQRLRDAAGSEILPDEQARILVDAFEALQDLRLRYQLEQVRAGHVASDRLVFSDMSPLDRSLVVQAVREITNAQRRAANVAAFVNEDEWNLPGTG